MVIRTSDPADDPAGAVFSGLSTIYVLNNLGRIVTEADLKQGVGGVTADNNHGIWSFENGVSTAVIREALRKPRTRPWARCSRLLPPCLIVLVRRPSTPV